MVKSIKVGTFALYPFPDEDGNMEIKTCSSVNWLPRHAVLDLTKALIENFKFTEEDLNGSTN